MTKTRWAELIRSISHHSREESIWGVPESSEFVVVQKLLQELQTRESDERRRLLAYEKISEETKEPLIRFF